MDIPSAAWRFTSPSEASASRWVSAGRKGFTAGRRVARNSTVVHRYVVIAWRKRTLEKDEKYDWNEASNVPELDDQIAWL